MHLRLASFSSEETERIINGTPKVLWRHRKELLSFGYGSKRKLQPGTNRFFLATRYFDPQPFRVGCFYMGAFETEEKVPTSCMVCSLGSFIGFVVHQNHQFNHSKCQFNDYKATQNIQNRVGENPINPLKRSTQSLRGC